MRYTGSTDEQLLGHLLAPPDLEDGVESLAYWGRRSRHLPWYRVRARREAAQMTVRWEQRVRAAVLSPRPTSLEARITGGALVARMRLARWTRRAGIAFFVAVTTVVTLVAIPTAAALMYVMHAL